MQKKGVNVSLTSYDDIFSTEQDRTAPVTEEIRSVPLSQLHPFKDHPFKVLDDDAMSETVESVKQIGVVVPLIARPAEDGYEIVSGHRRHHAAELAGLEAVPVIVREMDDDSAVIFMVDSNLQRENILPSEKALAYKMKMEAMKRQGERKDLQADGTSRQVVGKLEAADVIGQETGESGRQVQRYIRLTNLIPEVLDMVDQKQIAFNPAVELSYLKPEEQQDFLEAIDMTQTAPSLSQAQRIKKLSQEGACTADAICDVMSEAKKPEVGRLTFSTDSLRKYFPKSYTAKQMEETIIRLLEQYMKKRQRDMER
ncbi:ParB/RepB/Spo0J family partition protein [Oribacterium sp. HCP3S3_B9]|uniref:ParB/RepB/Spo0J family partition protein n=1 Tax=Oribacterium sp. HCP3S3_B9 TaxID=3438946 RepID=UPI003F8A6093